MARERGAVATAWRACDDVAGSDNGRQAIERAIAPRRPPGGDFVSDQVGEIVVVELRVSAEPPREALTLARAHVRHADGAVLGVETFFDEG